MTPVPGIHQLSEANGDLLIHTTVEGPAAALGHDLVLRAAHWRGTITFGETPATSSMEVTVDMTSLVTEGSRGGAKPVGSSDRKVIDANIRRALGVQSYPTLTFVSTSAQGDWDALTIDGTMTLRGRTEQQQLEVLAAEDGAYKLRGTITQTRFGITPFSTMIGAMRLGDDVKVRALVRL